ncbi:MAG: hypothetical protein MMC33_009922 [Icmadophila ericetorum]|nr:hypothetical protein [Icmadophila ericetorum]
MPESPPKRVTRARAKATEDTESGMKTAKILTASARAALANKTLAMTVKVSKRKTKSEEVKEAAAQSKMQLDDLPTEPSKVRVRSKKTAQTVTEAVVPAAGELPRTRSRADVTANPPPKTTLPSLPKTRGRPRKVAEAPAQAPENEATVVEPVKKSIRSPVADVTTGSSDASITKAPTARKKVTFKEELEQNKENINITSSKGKEVSQAPLTGLKAKALRKPPAPRASTRGKKGSKPSEDDRAKGAKTTKPLPLSPKKIGQMAKSLSSNESEDELCEENTPSRILTKSPVKPLQGPTRQSPLKVDASSNGKGVTDNITSSIFGSPARRPPPSPFKDALKETPKKIQFDVNSGPLLLPPARSPFKDSLHESPRRIKFDASSGPLVFPRTSPLKSSLLQSPARRPGLGSPNRTIAPRIPGKANNALTLMDAASTAKPFKTFLFTPSKLPKSPIKQAESVGTPATADDMTLGEDKTQHELLGQDFTPTKAQPTEGWGESPPQAEPEGSANPLDDVLPASNVLSPPSSYTTTFQIQQIHEIAENPMEENKMQADSTSKIDASMFDTFTNDSTPINPFSGTRLPWNHSLEDSDSEDELQSPQKIDSMSILRRYATDTPTSSRVYNSSRRTPGFGAVKLGSEIGADRISMTPLAKQLSSWLASSPDKKRSTQGNRLRGIFSPAISAVQDRSARRVSFTPSETLAKSSFFNDEIAVLELEHEAEIGEDQLNNVDLNETNASQGSQEYGDENVVTMDPQLLEKKEVVPTAVKVCTPVRTVFSNPREIHTVSKVPLRAADDGSPLKVFRKRSRSVSGGPRFVFSELKSSGSQITNPNCQGQNQATELPKETVEFSMAVQNFEWEANQDPSTPKGNSPIGVYTPSKTERKGADAEILRGAVVYVDVYTTEGADASGIFVELLTQMGARCVKQWNWNPRASIGRSIDPTQLDQDQARESSVPNNKVGITHVVFKDGGKRTLEKVNESKGQVLCVGVGWVLDCEQQNNWLSEAEYAVDVSVIPRGGSRRRKSMEPRMLANFNGNLVPAETLSRPESGLSPTKEFLNLSSPPTYAEPSTEAFSPVPVTPDVNAQHFDGESAWGSPMTPYYLSKGAELVQQTCPSKQILKPLFPVSGLIEDQPDENLRHRLLLARRKSLQWAPKVGSPLGR